MIQMKHLLQKIKDKSAVIGVIGLGYVGLPLALAFAHKFQVIGFDVNESTIRNLSEGHSHIIDISDERLKAGISKNFHPTHAEKDLKTCDFIIICVPTPLTPEKDPDLGYIKSACKTIAAILRKDQFIILESTTYPGTTDEVVVPILEGSGLKAGIDFGVAYSPERIDPGNRSFTVETIPKVVGGINKECTEICAALYSEAVNSVMKVKDARTAEAVKMLENIFRNVNIALVNELALIFEKMGIDTWEVIAAASTKPYGFMPFYPGPGVGGHCIPLDPYYMSYKAQKFGFIPRFIDTAGEINDFMKMHAINLAEQGLKNCGKTLFGAQVTLLGLSYKKNIDDVRESPSIKIIEELINLGAQVRVYDPFVQKIKTKCGDYISESSLEDSIRESDCLIFVIDHDQFKGLNLNEIVKTMRSPVIVDCKNIFSGSGDYVYLGLGK